MSSHPTPNESRSRREFLRALARCAGLAAVGGGAALLFARSLGGGPEGRKRLELCERCPRSTGCPDVYDVEREPCEYDEIELARRFD